MEESLEQAYRQAGITEQEIAIENVHLIRSTNAVEVSCALAAPLPPERLKPFEDAAFSYNVGDMTVVQTQFGWHVLYITGQR